MVPENKINQIAIDEIFDSLVFGVEQVKLLKMDTEGGEHSTFSRLFNDRKDILDRISYLHLEVHQYPEHDPKGLEDRVKAHFGERVFFDT